MFPLRDTLNVINRGGAKEAPFCLTTPSCALCSTLFELSLNNSFVFFFHFLHLQSL